MKIFLQFLMFGIVCSLFGSCASSSWMETFRLTRTEEDAFTITIKDTSFTDAVRNEPGERDNGIIYPSSRTLTNNSLTTQYDSVVERKYPNFVRFAVFESVGLIGTTSSDKGVGSGMFGIMGFFDPDFATITKGQSRSVTFTGGIYRVLTYETRLRWFRDAKDWTFGSGVFEALVPEVANEKTLVSILPMYLRKRYFLREQIPYIAVTPAVGIGLFPSQYINASVSLDVGSLGGLNMRLYGGYATGSNYKGNWMNNTAEAVSSSFPYAGLGISVLDFLNRVPELYREWKDHEHSGWDIGIFQFGLIYSGEVSAISSKNPTSPFRGYFIRITPTSLALPILDNRFYVGTSLFSVMILGQNKFGLGVLPIRIGYWHDLMDDELTLEPFVEYDYYPSSFVNLGARLNLKVSNIINLSANLGYVNGNSISGSLVPPDILGEIGKATSLSGAYFGLGISLDDRIFGSKELRYNR
ncbi:MAG: hypothetical protein HYZ54_01015 [Ignavibacteriae bacterium]|nr:hypothetical protein [Ignavibacteriota bacterium]